MRAVLDCNVLPPLFRTLSHADPKVHSVMASWRGHNGQQVTSSMSALAKMLAPAGMRMRVDVMARWQWHVVLEFMYMSRC